MTDQVRAYVLIQTQVNAPGVAATLRSMPGVESADDVSGPYDVIALAAAADLHALGELVVQRVQGIEGVTRTLTCPITKL